MDIWGRRRSQREKTTGKSKSSTRSNSVGLPAVDLKGLGAGNSNLSETNSASPPAESITLTLHVSNASFPVHCGNGHQTIKWLALSAARRFAACPPGGRVRCRESYHSGRRPVPVPADEEGSCTSPGQEHQSRRNLPRYAQFGIRDDSTGQILRRVDGIGGTYRQGMLLPMRVTSPKRKTRPRNKVASGQTESVSFNEGLYTNPSETISLPPAAIFHSSDDVLASNNSMDPDEDGEESFWDAIQVTYGYARMEHPHDQHLREQRDYNEMLAKKSDLKRQQLLLNFGNPDDPLWRRMQAAAMAESPRPSTVYELREVSGKRSRSSTAQNAMRDWRIPRRSVFAQLTPKEKKILRPTTTIAVTRPRYEAQSADTPLRHWGGPRITVPDSFTTPSDLFNPMSAALDPKRTIASYFKNGDHVWVDLDMKGGEASASAFSMSAFHRRRYVEKKAAEKIRTPSARSEVSVKVEEKRRAPFLVRMRHMSDENISDEKSRVVLKKLLVDNISKSKISRLIKDEDEFKKIKHVVLQRYLVLENTFRHFSFLAPGDNFSLSANEWSSLCSTCKILTSEPCIDAAVASRVFIASNVNLATRSGGDKPEPFDEDNPKNALIMYEFLEALLRLALEKYAVDKKSSPSEKLEKLLEENILPVGREITKSWEKTLQEVENDDVQEALGRDLNGLKFAFVFYAHKKPKKISTRAGRQEPHLTMEEWIHALEEASILETQAKQNGKRSKRQRSLSSASSVNTRPSTAASNVDDADKNRPLSSPSGLTHQRAQECFVAANSHSARLQRKHSAAAEERSFRQMEFPEFLEALVHVAARISASSSLADNIDTIAISLRDAIARQSQDTTHQRATSLFDRIDYKLETLQGND